MELRLNIQDKYADAFMALIQKLNYVEIVSSTVQKPTAPYKKLPKRPSANEIEAMIIKKALKDAQAIERGELKTRSFNSIDELLADLEADINEDNV